jgi:cell division protein FtsL
VLRLNLMLLAALMASALFLVHSQYESRRLFTELDRSINESRRLTTDNQRLEVEKRAQATPNRIEGLARDQLKMHSATPAITQYVGDNAGTGAAP